jgi:hypothetical protein
MAYSYQTAPLVSSGSYPTALTHYSMSKAFNDRLKAGPADCTRRIHQYMLSMTRQIRNPQEPMFMGLATVFPAQGEWSEAYAYVRQEDGMFPERLPGDWEGANLANPTNQFIFGIWDTMGEGDRLSTTMSYQTGPDSPENLWEIAKYQRGAVDLTTGNQYAPFFEAAQSHMQLVTPAWSFHGKSAGGIQPVPDANGYCKMFDGTPFLDQEIKFTAVTSTATIQSNINGTSGPYGEGYIHQYTGTCGPPNTRVNTGEPGEDTDVMWIAEMPFAWFIFLFSGEVQRLAKDEWLFSRDGGGLFSRVDADGMHRLLINPFLRDFRGTENQRAGACFNILDVGFDFDYFYKSQYQLAPSYGITVHEEEGVIPVYNNHTFTGTIEGDGSPIWTMHDGFRVGGYLITQQGVGRPFTIVYYESGNAKLRHTINPDTASMVVLLNTGSTNYCQFKIEESFTIPEGGSISVEVSELYAYKPEVWDAYAYLRLASSDGGGDDTEINAHNETQAAVISNYYKSSGACVNVNGNVGVGQQYNYINANPVYEAMRRQIQEWTRVMNRHQLLGYEVINDGGTLKSVLYMKRYITVDSVECDGFGGIINTTSTATNGIVTTAPAGGWTNEWVMDMSLKFFGGEMDDELDSSEWKVQSYGDFYPFVNRAQLMNRSIGENSNSDMFAYFQPTPSEAQIHELFRGMLVAPEAMSAYNYVRDVNPGLAYRPTEEAMIKFYKSCMIYPDPYYIQSATVDAAASSEYGVETVRLQFNKRFHHHESVTGLTVSRNMGTWDIAQLRDTQDYRTDENALMLYLLVRHDLLAEGTITPIIGDCALNALRTLQTWTGNPHASIIPHFFFTKLVPVPYLKHGLTGIPSEILNDPEALTEEFRDTDNVLFDCEKFHMMETYMRAICEGYVNSEIPVNCTSPLLGLVSSAWDYNWEDLNFQAHGTKWFSTFPASIRSDTPIHYGPPPSAILYADTINRLSSALNKLNRVRVALPFSMQCRTTYFTGEAYVAATEGRFPDCKIFGTITAALLNYTPPSAGTQYLQGEWEECGGASSGNGAGRDREACGLNGEFRIASDYYRTEYKFEASDPNSVHALTPDMQDLYTGNENGFFAEINETSTAVCHGKNYDVNSAQCACTDQANPCSDHKFGTNFFWWNWNEEGYDPIFEECPSNYSRTYCAVLNDGIIDVGSQPPTGDFFIGQNNKSGDLKAVCGTGTSMSKGASVIANTEVIVKIPLV